MVGCLVGAGEGLWRLGLVFEAAGRSALVPEVPAYTQGPLGLALWNDPGGDLPRLQKEAASIKVWHQSKLAPAKFCKRSVSRIMKRKHV